MRWCVVAALLCLTGCQPSFQFNDSQMTPEEMLDRATLVFVGVIQSQIFVNRPFLQVPTQDAGPWRVLDRRVTVEAIARSKESRKVIDVYEYSGIGGTAGDWNQTRVGGRYLFLVRNESGSYHVVRDWWRSIFPIGSGRHDRFPLDNSQPVWERVALLQYWVRPNPGPGTLAWHYLDPGRVLGTWREVKLLRGLTRHPGAQIQMGACGQLMLLDTLQDECADGLGLKSDINKNRVWLGKFAKIAFEGWLSRRDQPRALDELKVFTTINDRRLREEFCKKFQRAFPDDHDNGCPAGRPRPATIVTADGDVPLTGAWPSATAK
jgi:hypothetical protein